MRWTQLAVIVLCAMVLVACGDDSSSNNSEAGGNSDVVVKDGKVEVTFPPNYFEGLTEADIEASAKEQRIDVKTIHDDGAVTYTMSEKRHQELLEEVELNLEATVLDVVESGQFPSIKAVTANEDYTAYELTVDRELFEQSLDMIGALNLYIGSSYYYAYQGEANPKVTMNYIDSTTNEQYDSVVFPDALEEQNVE